MPVWIVYSLIATLFSGLTALFVKFGIRNTSPEFAMMARVGIVFAISILNYFISNEHKSSFQINGKTILFIVLSGITTAGCWIFYYKAIKTGTVSVISAIDKGSIIITILLAVTILGEPFTLKLIIGAGLILIGMIVLVL